MAKRRDVRLLGRNGRGGGGRTSLGKKLILSDTAILEILERFLCILGGYIFF